MAGHLSSVTFSCKVYKFLLLHEMLGKEGGNDFLWLALRLMMEPGSTDEFTKPEGFEGHVNWISI
jgi:hypothetical protein